MSHNSINTANTLSNRFHPGEDKRIATTKSESIFTFGDFRITRDTSSEALSGDSRHLKFDSFDTLESINGISLIPEQKVWVRENELHFKREKPENYTYFGSFYTDISNAINNIIENFPYTILSYNNNSGVTLTNYEEIVSGSSITSYFRIPFSSVTNQGEIILASGITTDKINLYNHISQFGIQLSGQSISDYPVHKILNYNFINLSGNETYLEFIIEGSLLGPSSSATITQGVYIRPSRERYNLYIKNLTSLERQLLADGKFYAPNADDDGETIHTIVWPREIDGFNPDTHGHEFSHYLEHVLSHASQIDDVKTNWIVRTMIPENYLDYDSEGQIYRKMVQVYAHEFDLLKRYIDGIAYAYTVPKERDNEESIPDKFLPKLAQLLAWELQGNFEEKDLFEYLAGEVDTAGTTTFGANITIWKRILSNINWLYKKKGTRDALTFIFKLIGAPDEIINFNEFVYKINRTTQNNLMYSNVSGSLIPSPMTAFDFSNKINENGYINYESSQFIFQEGGQGRGNGQAYINQWVPEFNPIRTIDNKKIYTGDSAVFGSEDTINSKEVNIELSAAKAIESDIKKYYTNSGHCINGVFIEKTDLFMEKCEIFVNEDFKNKTLSEYLDYIYTNSIDPTNRKTSGFESGIVAHYPTLKKAYLNYYFNETVPSKRLTFQKLENFLDKIGAQIAEYVFKLVPATTIFESAGKTYRNSLFTTPKYVYKEGINSGSEFRNKIIPALSDTITSPVLNSKVNEVPKPTLQTVYITGSTSNSINKTLGAVNITSSINIGINAVIPSHEVVSWIEDTNISITDLD